MNRWTNRLALMVMAAGLAGTGHARPVIQHDPIPVARKGEPLGVRATARDAAARIESVALFYAASRGTTPFRLAMSSSGAGVWFATIPGHMIGPGEELLYYIQAENADGESQETEWHTVRVVDSGVAPAAIPAASDVARQAHADATAAAAAAAALQPEPDVKPARNRYLVPAAVIVGGAVAIGGAYAIAERNSGGGGGGGGSPAITNANFGGSFSLCFTPTSETNTVTVCDSGLGNVYIREGAVEVIGLWSAEVFTTSLNGSVFSVARTVPATLVFPEAYLILSGEIQGEACTVRINGYSRDAENPGDFSGLLNATRR